MTAPTEQPRRRRFLAEIRRTGGQMTTGQAHAFYRATGWGPCRTTARKDLQAMARRGVLVERGPAEDCSYTLNSRKDVRP